MCIFPNNLINARNKSPSVSNSRHLLQELFPYYISTVLTENKVKSQLLYTPCSQIDLQAAYVIIVVYAVWNRSLFTSYQTLVPSASFWDVRLREWLSEDIMRPPLNKKNTVRDFDYLRIWMRGYQSLLPNRYVDITLISDIFMYILHICIFINRERQRDR